MFAGIENNLPAPVVFFGALNPENELYCFGRDQRYS